MKEPIVPVGEMPVHRDSAKASQAEQEPVAFTHTWDETGERCKVCGDKDWMGGSCTKPTEHTAAKPVVLEVDPAIAAKTLAGYSAVGVPDVDALIERLNSRYDEAIPTVNLWPLPNLHEEAATALAALQGQLANVMTKPAGMYFSVEAWKVEVDRREQQAAQIKELEADLLEWKIAHSTVTAERDALLTENAKFRNELVELDHCRELASKAEQYEKERDALKADAERYRWLRQMIFDDRIIVSAARMLHGDLLDEAVDAAREEP